MGIRGTDRHRGRGRSRRRRRGGDRRTATRHGVPRPHRPGGATRAAVERRAFSRRGTRARRRARRCARVGPSRRRRSAGRVHGGQAALARRQRTAARRSHGGGLLAARLADVEVAGRPRHPGHCDADHRSQRRQWHRLLRRCQRRLPLRPPGAGLARPAARTAQGARTIGANQLQGKDIRRGNGRQRRRGARAGRRRGRPDRLDRNLGGGGRRHCRPHPGRGWVRRGIR